MAKTKPAPQRVATEAPKRTAPSERDLPAAAWWAITVALGLVVYATTLSGELLWDDDALLAPSLMNDAHGLARIWSGDTLDYFPLTLTSFWIETQLGGGPMLHRVVSLALHLGTACVIGTIAARLGIAGGISAQSASARPRPADASTLAVSRAAGVLFAVHPMAVTSVAWIAERKNTLSLFLASLAVLVLLPAKEKTPSSRALALSFALFVLALLAKTQIVALPLVMLGVLWLRDGRPPPRVLGALGAMLLASLALGLVTVRFQHAVRDPATLVERVVRAADAVRFQLAHTLVPWPLAMVHGRDAVSGTSALGWLSLLALVAASIAIALALRAKKTWALPAAVALGSYLALLAPTLGLVPMAFMRFAFVSEHFGYAALAVPLVAIVALLSRFGRPGAIGTAVIALLFAFVSRSYAQAFTSPLALWARDVEVVASPVALGNLALAEQDAGETDDALRHAQRAVELAPEDAELHSFVGTVLMQRGRLDEAAAAFEHALALDSSLARAHNNLGAVLVQQGRLAEGTEHLEAALVLEPDYAIGHMNLARVLAVQGRSADAERERQRAVALDPSLAAMELPTP